MLVRLYDLPNAVDLCQRLRDEGVEVRRALAPEKQIVVNWVRLTFSEGWADECDVAFSRKPVACFIAFRRQELLGFACHDVTCRNFYGPLGVAPDKRGRGIGAVLSLVCLSAMAHAGYAYAIIGSVGPIEFFAKVAGATVIENSSPGIYRGLLCAG
jgi:hypothetical protein